MMRDVPVGCRVGHSHPHARRQGKGTPRNSTRTSGSSFHLLDKEAGATGGDIKNPLVLSPVYSLDRRQQYW